MITFEVNGKPTRVDVSPARRLLDVLREDLHLTGTKEGCGEGECGACSVIINGEAINSCLVPVCQVGGAVITTIEGLGSDRGLDPLQQAFLECGGAQCGICTPGMLISARVLLDSNPLPTREEIREAIAGNLCRCTGYQKIVDAIERAGMIERNERARRSQQKTRVSQTK
jgi:carbon-monoxide dehydrogenase small subunit